MRKNNNCEKMQIICNGCGKKILVEKEIVKEGVASFQVEWGYFSTRDGEIHSFDLCEDCYEKMIQNFSFPVDVAIKRELL